MALSGLRVLVVDDDQDSLDIASLFLEDGGAVVRCAKSADEAGVAFAELDPHVIVTDLAMPDTSGFDLLEKLREVWALAPQKAVPVILLTAHARRDVSRAALAKGFTSVLSKPVEGKTLVDAVAAAAGRK
jgi:CheY-like chemotaxis protein